MQTSRGYVELANFTDMKGFIAYIHNSEHLSTVRRIFDKDTSASLKKYCEERIFYSQLNPGKVAWYEGLIKIMQVCESAARG